MGIKFLSAFSQVHTSNKKKQNKTGTPKAIASMPPGLVIAFVPLKCISRNLGCPLPMIKCSGTLAILKTKHPGLETLSNTELSNPKEIHMRTSRVGFEPTTCPILEQMSYQLGHRDCPEAKE